MEEIKIFENSQFGRVRIAFTESSEPLFHLSDLCEAINVKNYRNVAKRIDQEGVRLMDTLTQGGYQKVIYVTEPGMYEVLLRSRTDKTKPFRKWVCEEVLPSIRRTGSYGVASSPVLPADFMDKFNNICRILNNMELDAQTLREVVMRVKHLEDTAMSIRRSSEYMSVERFVSLRRVKLEARDLRKMVYEAKKLCVELDEKPVVSNDPEYGREDLFPVRVLNRLFGID